MENITVYTGQTLVRKLDLSLFVVDPDFIESVSVDQSAGSGSLTSSARVLTHDTVELTLVGGGEPRVHTVDIRVDTESDRNLLICYKVSVQTMPEPIPVNLFQKPLELFGYDLQYAARLAQGETLGSEVTITNPHSCLHVVARRETDTALLLVVGSDELCDGSRYGFTVEVATSLGRVFTDTMVLHLHPCEVVESGRAYSSAYSSAYG